MMAIFSFNTLRMDQASTLLTIALTISAMEAVDLPGKRSPPFVWQIAHLRLVQVVRN